MPCTGCASGLRLYLVHSEGDSAASRHHPRWSTRCGLAPALPDHPTVLSIPTAHLSLAGRFLQLGPAQAAPSTRLLLRSWRALWQHRPTNGFLQRFNFAGTPETPSTAGNYILTNNSFTKNVRSSTFLPEIHWHPLQDPIDRSSPQPIV